MTPAKKEYKRPSSFNRKLFKLSAGIGVLILALYLFSSSFGQSGAGDQRARQLVGSDLLLEQKVGKTRKNEQGSGGVGRLASAVDPRRRDNFLTPISDYVEPFSQKQTLEFLTHEVKEGESLWAIAQAYGREVYTVVSVNLDKLRLKNGLHPGMKLRVPNRDGILTELNKGQTLTDLASAYGTDLHQIISFNELENPRYISNGKELFIPGARPLNSHKLKYKAISPAGYMWPVNSASPRVTSSFGNRIHPVEGKELFHTGIDIAGDYGGPAYAARAGRVKFTGSIPGYGHVVTVVHPDGHKSLYAHLSAFEVRVGMYVEQGQVVGRIGDSGHVTGSHLHFEIRKSGQPVNPIKYLRSSDK